MKQYKLFLHFSSRLIFYFNTQVDENRKYINDYKILFLYQSQQMTFQINSWLRKSFVIYLKYIKYWSWWIKHFFKRKKKNHNSSKKFNFGIKWSLQWLLWLVYNIEILDEPVIQVKVWNQFKKSFYGNLLSI